jgi:hypothetical protein
MDALRSVKVSSRRDSLMFYKVCYAHGTVALTVIFFL